MLSALQKDQIQRLLEITNRSKILIVAILMYFSWDMEKSTDFILNAGDFLSEDLVPESRRQAAEVLLKQEEEQEQQLLNQLYNCQQGNQQKQIKEKDQLQINNQQYNQVQNDGADKTQWIQKKNKRINQITEQLQELENYEWENNKIIQERLSIIKNSKIEEFNNKLYSRMYKTLIGMKNNEGTGFFNCIYQVLFQNPELVESILSLPNLNNKEDQNYYYLNELQFLFGSFILSSDGFVKNSNIYVAANRLNKIIMVNNELNFAQQFQNQIEIINKCIQDINKQNQVSIFENTFQQFVNSKIGGQKSLYLKLEQEDRSFHLSLLKQFENLSSLRQQYTSKTYWSFQINRSGSKDKERKSNENNVDYWFPKKIDLEILFSKMKVDKILSIFEESINDETIKEIKKLQQIVNSLHIVISYLDEQDFKQEETIKSQKVEKEILEKQLQNYLPFNTNLISKDDNQNQKYNYCLQATVIEIQEENVHLFYVYIYNFNEAQWYRINDFQVSVVNEDLVMNDTRKNGCFLVYIHQQQISRVKGYQQTIFEIASKMLMNQGDISKELIQGYPILNGLNSKQIEQIQNGNREIVKILDEELNQEFNY